MEEISLIIGDSSSIYEFSSKQVSELDALWEASWVVSDTLGSTPILTGNLVKNEDIFNDDSLIGQDFRKTYKIFETDETEVVAFNPDIIVDSTCTVSGNMTKGGVAEADRYITITIKGIFVSYSREVRVKTDINGDFTYDFNIGPTVKTPANSYFIFQLSPLDSEQLENKSYILSVEVRQKDVSDNIIFRREVLTAKLKMTIQGVV
jgi:hypothetical protein